jgi:hypothetical protein
MQHKTLALVFGQHFAYQAHVAGIVFHKQQMYWVIGHGGLDAG